MRAFSLFIKQRDLVIKKEEYRLARFMEQLDKVQKEISRLSSVYEALKDDFRKSRIVAEVSARYLFSREILDEIEKKQEERRNLLKEVESLKKRLAVLNGEKKAVEKFIMKLEKEKRREELIQEGRLADEVFSRRFSDSSIDR
ncbi:hypothetical protein [Desulfurobacterium sp.]